MPKLDLANESLLAHVERHLKYKRNAKANRVLVTAAMHKQLGGIEQVGKVKVEVIDRKQHQTHAVQRLRPDQYAVMHYDPRRKFPGPWTSLETPRYQPGLSKEEAKIVDRLSGWRYDEPTAYRLLDYHLKRRDLALALHLVIPDLTAGLADPFVVMSHLDLGLIRDRENVRRKWGTVGTLGLDRTYVELGGVEVGSGFQVGHLEVNAEPGHLVVVDGRRAVQTVEIPAEVDVPEKALEVYVTLTTDDPTLHVSQAYEMAQALAAA